MICIFICIYYEHAQLEPVHVRGENIEAINVSKFSHYRINKLEPKYCLIYLITGCQKSERTFKMALSGVETPAVLWDSENPCEEWRRF